MQHTIFISLTLKQIIMKMRKQILGFCLLIPALILSSCKKENTSDMETETMSEKIVSENGTNPDELMLNESDNNSRFSLTGYVYTMSNDAAQNSILCYKQHINGQLTFESSTPSGGTGSNSGLGSQGSIILNRHNNWLYAVNAGDNSISSFMVQNNGSLVLAHTVSSGGQLPVSVTTYHDYLYVLNAGSDNIKGFHLSAGGMMTEIPGSVQSLSTTGAGGAQISFSNNGRYLYVTEKATNMISIFMVNGMGVAQPGSSISSVGQTPFGFEFARNNFMIVSNAAGGTPGQSSATSYSGTNSGNLADNNGAVPNQQTAACWVAVTEYGRFAFVTNTGSDNISSYYVSSSGNLYLLHPAIPSGDSPIDMVISGNNIYAYALCSMDHTIRGYTRTFFGGLIPNTTTTNLPMYAAGLVAF
jgi:6-phosphogluconolactonase